MLTPEPAGVEERTVVLMPMRDRATLPTQRCLESKTDGPCEVLTEIGLPVDVARNRLAERVLSLPNRPRYVIWADSDAVWDANTFERLRDDVRRLGPAALVGVLHGPRAVHSHPHAMLNTKPPLGTPIEWGTHYPKTMEDPSALLPVTFVGGHMYAHDVRLLDRLGPQPWTPTQHDCSEDFAFVMRVHRSGGSVWCDTAVPVFHFDEASGFGYLPGYCGPFMADANGRMEQVEDAQIAARAARQQTRRSYGSVVDEQMEQHKRTALAVAR